MKIYDLKGALGRAVSPREDRTKNLYTEFNSWKVCGSYGVIACWPQVLLCRMPITHLG